MEINRMEKFVGKGKCEERRNRKTEMDGEKEGE
jgi:hypothetical protein